MSHTSDRFRQKERGDENQNTFAHDKDLIEKLRSQIAEMEQEKKAKEPVKLKPAEELVEADLDTSEEIHTRISDLEKEISNLKGKLKK